MSYHYVLLHLSCTSFSSPVLFFMVANSFTMLELLCYHSRKTLLGNHFIQMGVTLIELFIYDDYSLYTN